MRALPALLLTPVLLSAPSPRVARADEPERIVTTDGRVIVGPVRASGAALLVKENGRHVYLSPAIVKERGPAQDVSDVTELSYTVNTEESRKEKRGSLGAGVRVLGWGAMGADGKLEAHMLDKKHGEVRFTMIPTRITPQTMTFSGVQYMHRVGWPTRTMISVARNLIAAETPGDDVQALTKALRFFAAAGDTRAAEAYRAQLEQLDPGLGLVESERLARIEREARLSQVLRLAQSGRTREAARLGKDLELAGLAKDDPRRAELDALSRAASDWSKAELLLKSLPAGSGPALELTSAEEAQRFLAARAHLAERGAAPQALAMLGSSLIAPWGTTAIEVGLDAQAWQAARDLAAEIASAWAEPRLEQRALRKLAKRIGGSSLPTRVKAALLRQARDFPLLPEGVGRRQGWDRIEYRHPRERQTFHYYVRFPPGYRPGRPAPVLLALHGMSSTAEVMRHAWAEHCDRWGLILVSPEYIYGREWGYYYSVEEHEAVLGALEHLSLSADLDHDRVYLTGQSQGGHTSWDLGPSHAGRFAAVVPIIGVSMSRFVEANFVDLPLYAIGGEEDKGMPELCRPTIRKLAETGCDATYVEYQDRGHEGFGEEYTAVCRWLLAHRRPSPRRRVGLAAARPCETRRAWIEISKPGGPLPKKARGTRRGAVVTGRWEGNTCRLESGGAARLAVYLDPELVDLSQPVEVVHERRKLFQDVVDLDWELALADLLARRDPGAVYLARIELRLGR